MTWRERLARWRLWLGFGVERWRLWLGFGVDLADGTHHVAPGPYLFMGPAEQVRSCVRPEEYPYDWERDGL
jgi:hypothetical protein